MLGDSKYALAVRQLHCPKIGTYFMVLQPGYFDPESGHNIIAARSVDDLVVRLKSVVDSPAQSGTFYESLDQYIKSRKK